MKAMNKIGIAALSLLTMACSNDDGTQSDSGPVAVKFSSNINLTRAVNNTWEESDKIGIYMLQSGSSEIAEQAGNRKYKPNVSDNTLLPDGAEQTIYYPEDGSAVNFMAYYPFRELSETVYSIDVSDQSQQNAIDFLHAARTEDKTQDDPNIALAFEHKLCKLILNVSAPAGTDLSTLKVKIYGMNTTASFNLLDGTWSEGADPKEIEMYRSNNQFEAILLPAALSDACTAEFVLEDETFTWMINKNIPELVAGNKYIYQVTLTPEIPILTPAGVSGTILDWTPSEGEIALNPDVVTTYSIGDYYPDPNVDTSDPEAVTGIEGIVIAVSDGGKHGKILSLVESSGLLWSTTGAQDETLDQDDGMVNFNIIKAKDATFTEYPAFAWCASLGEGWYIPAVNELLAVRTVWGATNAEKEAFNARITEVGGDAIKASVYVEAKGSNQSAYYYTSTEKADAPNKILSVSFNSTSGASDGLKKSSNTAENLLFRAIKAF